MRLEKLEEVEDRFTKVEESLGDEEILRNQAAYQKLAKEHSDLAPLIGKYRQLKALNEAIRQNTELLEDPDPEMRDLARTEMQQLREQSTQVEEEILVLLLPKDPNDEKNTLLEIRAGTGGEEAALFAADLFRLYSKFAEIMHWRVEIMSDHPTGMGGFKEIIVLIEGQGAYSKLKYESGAPPGAAGALHRSPGAAAHLGRYRGRLAGGRRSGCGHRSRRNPGGCLPFLRSGRAERQHHRLRDSDHPFAYRSGRLLPG